MRKEERNKAVVGRSDRTVPSIAHALEQNLLRSHGYPIGGEPLIVRDSTAHRRRIDCW